MRQETKEWFLLIGKSILVIIGGILVTAALVDLVVAGINRTALIVLVVGLAFCLPPLAFAYRDAMREARQGRL